MIPELRHLASRHIGLFEAQGVLAIQRIDETAPDDFTDEDAIKHVITMAKLGNREAILALHLEGWNAKSDMIDGVIQLHAFGLSPNGSKS
jgi:hypothetical protein